MKRFIKSLVLVTLFAGMAIPSWGQAPSTEGKDFWVTFLRAADNNPTELKLTISAKDSCLVTIANPNDAQSSFTFKVGDNSCIEVGTNTRVQDVNGRNKTLDQSLCYSSNNSQATYTALHVTATKDISLFAGNYRDKSFDAANIIPTAALLDDYLVQTYPPSDHEDNPQGSHFAIVAVEDGQTTVDYTLTAAANSQTIGAHSVTLSKGQVYYVWTGLNKDDAADLSGTTVKARNNKKIAVFQGCPHTNLPNHVRDRDHIFSQAMPTAYWGSEFAITASRHHRRDIIAVMAINDGTEVYINDEDGEKVLVHTFDFTQDKKRYWTFEIGEELAYCADKEGESPSHGKLPEPLVIDSSCYLTTSCPAGVHLFMVSNRYDNLTPTVKSDTLVSDPAMLWISPIEQVIKEINFATYKTQQAKEHYMNIVTTTANVPNMTWTDENDVEHAIQQYFHPLSGNADYSFARIQIQHGHHNIKGYGGFLAHVYGYGERESYAYSCGSSTIQRSVTFNGQPLMIDSIYPGKFCLNEDIEMKLNIGNNDYESIVWNFGDGITATADPNASNEEKKQTSHVYTTPGWYDLTVSAVYINSCTGQRHNEDMHFAFRVVRPDTVKLQQLICMEEDYTGPATATDTTWIGDCDTVLITGYEYSKKSSSSYELTAKVTDGYELNGHWYTDSYQEDTLFVGFNAAGCDSIRICKLTLLMCLVMELPEKSLHICPGDPLDLQYSLIKGQMGEMRFICGSTNVVLDPRNGFVSLPTEQLKPGIHQAKITVYDVVCEQTLEFPLDITVYYPSDIFKFKFNNVLAVYNKEYNGGYDFTAYQWYYNGQKIEGANTSVYHSDVPLKAGEYFVMLTNTSGLTLPSCSQTIQDGDIPDYSDLHQAPATKHLINRQIVIRKGAENYNIYGQKIK